MMGSWYQSVNFGVGRDVLAGQMQDLELQTIPKLTRWVRGTNPSTFGSKIDEISTFRDVLAGQMQDLELEKQLVDRQACTPPPPLCPYGVA